MKLDNLKPNTRYYYYASVKDKDGDLIFGDTKYFTTSYDYSTLEGVDLGLSVKWADRNIGATQPEESSTIFYWGETKASTSKDWHEFSLSTLISHGYIDNNNNLCPSYDTATELWGDKWRMPTKDEFQELIDKCEWKRVNKNGHSVFLITGPNGNFIYLPFGYHWSSTCNSNQSYCLYTSDWWGKSVDKVDRSRKNFIRPVMK